MQNEISLNPRAIPVERVSILPSSVYQIYNNNIPRAYINKAAKNRNIIFKYLRGTNY